MACRPPSEPLKRLRLKAINSHTGEGQPGRCPFQIRGIVDGHSTQTRTKRTMRNASLCAHLLHRICIGCSKLYRRAQQDSERIEMGRQLTAAYYSCVRTSFASQLPTMVDRNMAI